ncbi:MAG TPA: NUDIX hydrolase [Thermoanaerobaculia bacterium]|nr:NUDIX hydrolase [Thermoanaerobaculia bacterium]
MSATARWRRIRSEPLGDFRIFTIRRDRIVSPRTEEELDFYVLDGSDWVNVIPLTGEGNVVLVRQYRHGTEETTIEIPGGGVDAKDASPLAAARRELLEETGHAADEWTDLGWVHPNPAIQSNRCWTFLARGCRRVASPQLDPGEDIEIFEAAPDEVRAMLRDGRITHSLVVAAFAKFW